jgi:electron transfer flavoprotein alpha subunit
MSVLVLAEHYEDKLSGATLSAVTAATQIDSDVHVLVPGSGCRAVAEEAARVAGVSKVRLADDARYEHPLAEPLAALVAGVGGDYSHILAAATKHGKNVLPRAAALLDVTCITDISAVESPDTFERPIYAGNATATVQTADAPKVISVRSTSFEPAAAQGGEGAIEALAAAEDPGLSRFVSQNLTQSDRPELGSARIVISGGRGLGSKENFKLLESIADKLGAAIGASRAAVDAGYVPNDYQVGQTGKVVAPDLYIAVGISGAIQHLAGMKDSKVIVAINKDEEAPIFQVADYGLVADLFKALPEFEGELDKG